MAVETSPEPATVLVVDDSADTRSALVTFLEAKGFHVVSGVNGVEALRLLTDQKCDAVVLDFHLPQPDGAEILRLIRTGNALPDIPVLVISGDPDRERRLNLLRLGADDFFAKPIDTEELVARLSRCIQLKQRQESLIAQRDELQRLSITDGLTQVQNHRFFQERLREEFRRAQRYDDPLGLILLDLDHFKQINDRHGHQAGDEVLRDVARCLRGAVRETDLLARYGGEEFAVLLPKTHLAGSLTVAERIWRDLGALKTGPDGQLSVTASLGVSVFPGRAVTSDEQLLQTADVALYRAKREGRNKICLFQQDSFFSPTAPDVSDTPDAKAS